MTNQETEPKTSASISTTNSKEWWKLLTGYHWFVLLVASAAWFFDCLDPRIFSLARNPALASLMHAGPGSPEVQNFGKVVTAWFLIGWGIGGMIFGALGDRYGRARMLTITILVYSAFTGLSFFSQTKVDFTIFRFLTGLGVGGVFGLAVALIAETVPSGARAQSLGLLQVLSTIGNVTAGFTLKGFSKRLRACTGWNCFGDKRHRETEHAADSKARQKPEDCEINFRLAEETQPGKRRIDQDRNREHPRAAIAVTKSTEDHSADTPADEKPRSDNFPKVLHFRTARPSMHQRGKRWISRKRKNPLIKTIKKPRRGRDEQDEPVITREQLPPFFAVRSCSRV